MTLSDVLLDSRVEYCCAQRVCITIGLSLFSPPGGLFGSRHTSAIDLRAVPSLFALRWRLTRLRILDLNHHVVFARDSVSLGVRVLTAPDPFGDGNNISVWKARRQLAQQCPLVSAKYLNFFHPGGVVFSLVYAVFTFIAMLLLIPHTTRASADRALSRVGIHFQLVNFLFVSWILSMVVVPLRHPDRWSAFMSAISACGVDRFLALRCIPIGLDVVLPLAILATLICASWTVYHRAVALHGEQVSLEIAPLSTSRGRFLSASHAPPAWPAWMRAHVADIEREDGYVNAPVRPVVASS
ncbi:hypothetical protein B0H10DRAFT_1997914 [Mycena sp. CBHHK59/15]|nr:hypothetical protein B0H10DRAFT_1997914 [Mycena sp. CBHHK59/15]